ncbi:hypothetical protein JD844_012026, partial [Phrynosoma platyrhinos]
MEAPSTSANPVEQETQTGNVNPKRRKHCISNSSDDGLSTYAELAKEEAGEISKAWNRMVDTISAEPPVMQCLVFTELVFVENSYEDPEASESPVTASKSGDKSMKHNREEPQDATTPVSKKQKNEQAVSDGNNLYQCFEGQRKKATTLSACFAEMQKKVVKRCEILRCAKGYEDHLNYMWDNPVSQVHIDAFYESIKSYNQYILNRSIEHRQIGRGSQNALEVSDSSRDDSQPLHASIPDSPDDEGPPAVYAEH